MSRSVWSATSLLALLSPDETRLFKDGKGKMEAPSVN